jgi:hypothetical protein
MENNNNNGDITPNTQGSNALQPAGAENSPARQLVGIRRMVATLDKFLSRRMMGLAAFYAVAMLAGLVGIISNGAILNASDGNDKASSYTVTWIASILITLTFLFVALFARFLTLKYRKK